MIRAARNRFSPVLHALAACSLLAASAQAQTLGHVEKRGDGPVPLILIPDLGFDWSAFEPFMDRNDEAYTMYAVTLPGFGDSDAPSLEDGTPPSQTVWLDGAVQAVADLIEEEGIDQPVIVGHGLGGELAFRIVTEHDDITRSAVIFSALPAKGLTGPAEDLPIEERYDLVDNNLAPRFGQAPPEQFVTRQRVNVAAAIRDKDRGQALSDMLTKCDGGVLLRYLLEEYALDSRDEVVKTETPILVAFPAKNDMIPADDHPVWIMKAWVDDLSPNVTTTIVMRTSHYIIDDRPDVTDRLVADFIAEKPISEISD